MKFIERLFGERLAPSWEHETQGVIWKIHVTAGGILVGESRDLDAHAVSLFGVRLDDGALLFSGVQPAEPWWIALESTVGEVAILHTYPRPDIPSALGATAIDAQTGAQLWSDPELRVICGIEEVALAQRGSDVEQPELFFIDARTSNRLEPATPERAREFQDVCADSARWDGWIASEDLEPGDVRLVQLGSAIAREAGQPQGPIEVAESGPFTVLSVHVPTRAGAEAALNNRVDDILLVFRDGKVVYRDTVSTDAPHPSHDVFFIRNGLLIYVRAGRTLVGVELGEGEGRR